MIDVLFIAPSNAQGIYQDLAKEGYLKNAIVYRCVNEISKGASSVSYDLKAGDQVLETHPLISLMDRPNPMQSYSEFFNALYGFLLLSGNAYVLKQNEREIADIDKQIKQEIDDGIIASPQGPNNPDEII